jgi:hypothetical protein
MGEREIIQDKIRKKEQEIQSLEEKLRTAKIYLHALNDISKALSKESHTGPESAALREGSAVAQAREFILRRGAPVHINDLLEGLGKELTRESRASLTSSIAAYVRRGEMFTRSAPNTFGLAELGHATSSEHDGPIEPPEGFGQS